MYPDRDHGAGGDIDWAAISATARAETRRSLRDPHDAEDAAQETLVRAWLHIDGCRSDDPRAWVRQIARREVIRLVRQRDAARARDIRWAGAEVPHETALDRVDLRADIQRATAGLSTADRALLIARYVLDLTQPSAAALVGVPEGTAKVRLHRMRKKLAAAL